MRRNLIRSAAAATLALLSATVLADDDPSVQSRCAAKTSHSYGFQCHGWASVGPGQPLEQVTFLGIVSGSRTGKFTGAGTFNSSLGGARQRVTGQAQFQDRYCSGHIQYEVTLVLPGGGEMLLPPLDIDFVTVNGGSDVLGAPTALPGVVGNAVPRMVCRLMRSEGRGG
jgi:hypothetical protein